MSKFAERWHVLGRHMLFMLCMWVMREEEEGTLDWNVENINKEKWRNGYNDESCNLSESLPST